MRETEVEGEREQMKWNEMNKYIYIHTLYTERTRERE